MAAALDNRSKMFRMWYVKQASGFCGLGFCTRKWEKTEKKTQEKEIEASRCLRCGMLQDKVEDLNKVQVQEPVSSV